MERFQTNIHDEYTNFVKNSGHIEWVRSFEEPRSSQNFNSNLPSDHDLNVQVNKQIAQRKESQASQQPSMQRELVPPALPKAADCPDKKTH